MLIMEVNESRSSEGKLWNNWASKYVVYDKWILV